ncbi:hypothetical protein GGR50DRAFT_157659 [Xylaria sp. CBS 124048]|nr:hypothetical protein GGR50DRAFT_157659 [Xylaria sp. CBS 124048]
MTKMASITKSSLFHKKSKASLKSNSDSEDQKHSRKWSSSSSTLSVGSTDAPHRHKTDRFNPLSLHPPLTLNASPHILPIYEYDMERYQADEEREARFFHQTHYAHDHIQNLAEYSPVKGENCYFDGARTRPYLHERDSEWPLKNWQGISADISPPSSAPSSASTSPRQPVPPTRRNADWMDDRDVFIKRGAWKRQGIVFGLRETDEDFQEQHFELPLSE